MILAELAPKKKKSSTGLAGLAARAREKLARRLFVLIYLVGTLVTAFLRTTRRQVVLTPAVLAVVRRAKVDPSRNLLACAFHCEFGEVLFFRSQSCQPCHPFSSACRRLGLGAHFSSSFCRLPFFSRFLWLAVAFTQASFLERFEANSNVHRFQRKEKLALVGLAAAAAALISSSALGPFARSTDVLCCLSCDGCRRPGGNRKHSAEDRESMSHWSVLPLIGWTLCHRGSIQLAGAD